MKKVLFLTIVALLTACSDSSSDNKKSVEKDTTLTASMVKAWPFSFDSLTVHCKYAPAVVGENGGTLYALNGIANSQADSKGFTKVTPDSDFWLENKSIPGTKISVSEVIDKAIKICQ